jgi:hypothetical protein
MVHLVALLSSSISLGIDVPAITDALDNAIRDDLQSRSDTFFLWVLISAGIVVVGVALEGPEIFHELWPNLFSWFTWQSKERLHKFERRIKVIGLAGWLLVVFGVAGEAIFEVLQNRAEGQFQTFNGILLKSAQREAGSAAKSAEGAAGAAGKAQGSADTANDAAGEAREKADAAGRSAEKIGTLEAELKSEVEEDDLVLLAKESGHTYFRNVFNTLKKHPPARVTVTCAVDADPLTLLFTRRLAAALSDIGWVSPNPTSCGREVVPDGGVVIFNKWITRGPLDAPQWLLPDAFEVDPVKAEMEVGSNLAPQRERLTYIALSLNASLQKSDLNDDTLRIVVGKGKSPHSQ